MGVIISCVLSFLRILSRPICPASPNSEFNGSEQKVTFLLLLHILSSLFVFISVNKSEQYLSDKQSEHKIETWAIVMVFVIVGITSLVVLVIRGYQNNLKVPGTALTRVSDPSLNLRIIFLWIFGLFVIVHVLIDIAINIHCMETQEVGRVREAISVLSNITLLIYLHLQLSFITYYRNSTFVQNIVVNISSIAVLVANFAIWFNSVMSSINVLDINANTTIPKYGNESYCYQTSSIQIELGNKLRPFLLPPRSEFCILASIFIISFWTWPLESQQENNIYQNINSANDDHRASLEIRHQIIGPHVFISVLGILLNIPVLFSHLMLAFVFNWKQEDVYFVMHLGQCVSSVCNIIAIYICSYHLVRRFDNCWRPARLTTNEHILIMSSSVMVAYFVFGVLTALYSPFPVYMFLISRIIALLETFLQTHFLLKLKRYKTEGKTSVLISSTGIFLMIKNLIFWFVYSYNAYHHLTTLDLVLVDTAGWFYMKQVLGPVKTFYRFFSGMISYSVYHKFKSNHCNQM